MSLLGNKCHVLNLAFSKLIGSEPNLSYSLCANTRFRFSHTPSHDPKGYPMFDMGIWDALPISVLYQGLYLHVFPSSKKWKMTGPSFHCSSRKVPHVCGVVYGVGGYVLGLHPFAPATDRFIGWAHNHKAPNKWISYSERITALFDYSHCSSKWANNALPQWRNVVLSLSLPFPFSRVMMALLEMMDRALLLMVAIMRKVHMLGWSLEKGWHDVYMCNSHERKMTRLTICGKNRIYIIIVLCLALPNVTSSCVLSRYRTGEKPDRGFISKRGFLLSGWSHPVLWNGSPCNPTFYPN